MLSGLKARALTAAACGVRSARDSAGDAWTAGGRAGGMRRDYRRRPLSKGVFFGTNPISVKTARRLMGVGNGGLRRPLCPMSAANEAGLRAVLEAYGLEISA